MLFRGGDFNVLGNRNFYRSLRSEHGKVGSFLVVYIDFL